MFQLYGSTDREGKSMFEHHANRPVEFDYDAVNPPSDGILDGVTARGNHEGFVEIIKLRAGRSAQIRLDSSDPKLYMVLSLEAKVRTHQHEPRIPLVRGQTVFAVLRRGPGVCLDFERKLAMKRATRID
jgi:hypothetical protein